MVVRIGPVQFQAARYTRRRNWTSLYRAMLASMVYAVALCHSVCLFVCQSVFITSFIKIAKCVITQYANNAAQ